MMGFLKEGEDLKKVEAQLKSLANNPYQPIPELL